MPDADAVLVIYAPITAEVLDGMPNCKVVVRYGVGWTRSTWTPRRSGA